jgi:dTMP kinase
MNRNPKEKSCPFILVMEGVDFSGKTTLAQEIRDVLVNQNYRVKLLHDPKGSKNAQVIWETILTIKEQGGDPTTEFFLFLAARNELIHQEALVDEVDVIIFDRFIFSTIAYQLTYKPQAWEPFLMTHRFFSGLMPDLCIYCDLNFATFQVRNKNRNKQDLFDQMSKKRFEAIQLAYEQVLELQLCPSFRVNNLQYDFSQLIEKVENCLLIQSQRLRTR